MRFILTEEFWALDALSPAEWHLVSKLPDTASGESASDSSRQRLLPPPFAPEEPADEDTLSQLDDWERYVQPDIEDGFRRDREVVEEDLGRAESFAPEEILESERLDTAEGASELRRVTVPHEHTDSWYSTLNQARLLMNEEHDLASGEDDDEGEDIQNMDEQRMVVLAQYELYSVVQSILVENVMDP